MTKVLLIVYSVVIKPHIPTSTDNRFDWMESHLMGPVNIFLFASYKKGKWRRQKLKYKCFTRRKYYICRIESHVKRDYKVSFDVMLRFKNLIILTWCNGPLRKHKTTFRRMNYNDVASTGDRGFVFYFCAQMDLVTIYAIEC